MLSAGRSRSLPSLVAERRRRKPPNPSRPCQESRSNGAAHHGTDLSGHPRARRPQGQGSADIRGQGAGRRSERDRDPARQFRLRRLRDVRRRDEAADAGAARQERVDLQQFPHGADLLGEPRSAANGTQSPQREHGNHLGDGHGLSRARIPCFRTPWRPSRRSCDSTATARRCSASPTNTWPWESGLTGPFDQWPTGLGFERFYGNVIGESDQFSPSSTTTRRWCLHRKTRTTTTRPILRIAPSNGSRHRRPSIPTSPSSSTTPRRACTTRFSSPRRGETSTRASSIRVGTNTARRSWRARRSSASSRPTPSSRPSPTSCRTGTR